MIKIKYFAIILDDDTIGITNQFYILKYLRTSNRIKQSKSFFDFESAQRWIIQYIFVNLTLEDYGMSDIEDKNSYTIELNKFIKFDDIKHKKHPLDILFNNNKPKRKCMDIKMRTKKARDGFYSVLILKNNAIGIFETKKIFDEIKKNNQILYYRGFLTYKEADEYIRETIPFNEWINYNLDVGYLKVDNLLKKNKDEYENLQYYCNINIEELQKTHQKRTRSELKNIEYPNISWKDPPKKKNFHYNPEEIHKVTSNGFVSMDNSHTTTNKKDYISYYNEDLKQWVHRKINNDKE